MTVTVEEVIAPATIGASSSGSIPITTTLLSTDLVLIILSRAGGGHTVTINGSTPPLYNNWQNGTGGTNVFVYTKTGITGSSHAVSYTTAGTTSATQYTVLVVRGLTNRAITADAKSDLGNTSTTANTDEGPAAQTADTGQLAVFLGATQAGTVTFPSNPTPSGWTTDRSANSGIGTQCVAHYVPTSSVSVQANLRTSTFVVIGTQMLIVGDAVSVPPLTSTFVGWGNPIF